MSEKFTPYFRTSTGESLAESSIAKRFYQRQDLSPIAQKPVEIGQEIQIRVAKD
jgi:hypothetical protein